MRFKSEKVNGFQVFAVSGVNTISFAIDATLQARKSLLGFSVERYDPTENERYYMYGFKVFRSLIPDPDSNLQVTTNEHPIQSFVWDDFTAKPGRAYEYSFQPLRGKPKNLDRSAKPVRIKVRTEPLFTKNDHDVFFNRGVASSQAYERKFGNRKPSDMNDSEKQRAIDWLSRDLDDAILKFIGSAGSKDTLLCCFYEFHYDLIVKALAAVQKKIKDLRIIIDAKENTENFPRDKNLEAIRRAGIPSSCIIRRDSNPSDIQHNKFMVLLKGERQTPTDVWTGSTNISLGAFSGQTNVGHWVHDKSTAASFKAYWDLLEANPGCSGNDDRSTATKRKKAYRTAVENLLQVPKSPSEIPKGTTAVFSPRSGLGVLDMYVDIADEAESMACVTLAFGINDRFKDHFKDNTPQDHLTFLLLEKRDKPRTNGKKPFVAINANNNVYQAWGSYISDPAYQWARETNPLLLGLNTHVSYIHSKFMLHDPLGEDPIVVTGSANFSDASTTGNDENMMIIRGNKRVADIYLTEFNRLFNHYYFRSVVETAKNPKTNRESELFLKENADDWLKKYSPGTLKTKRLKAFTGMKGFTTA